MQMYANRDFTFQLFPQFVKCRAQICYEFKFIFSPFKLQMQMHGFRSLSIHYSILYSETKFIVVFKLVDFKITIRLVFYCNYGCRINIIIITFIIIIIIIQLSHSIVLTVSLEGQIGRRTYPSRSVPALKQVKLMYNRPSTFLNLSIFACYRFIRPLLFQLRNLKFKFNLNNYICS